MTSYPWHITNTPIASAARRSINSALSTAESYQPGPGGGADFRRPAPTPSTEEVLGNPKKVDVVQDRPLNKWEIAANEIGVGTERLDAVDVPYTRTKGDSDFSR